MNTTPDPAPPVARPMVIVGAGHVGGRAAQALREAGWAGPIVLVGAEPEPPYERPPLSKAVLLGERRPEDGAIAPLPADLTMRLSTRCSAIDRAARTLTLTPLQPGAAPEALPYEALLLATGGHARALSIPGADLPAVQVLRNAADARALAPRLGTGSRVLLVGGGFIGLEVAASARQRGAAVALVEGAPRLMGRAVPAALAERAAALHRAHGVALHLGCLPTAIEPAEQGVNVSLSDGSRLAADVVVVGIGIAPAVELAREAGLAVAQGIVVDAELRSSDPHIWAAGDVAEFPSPLSGRPMRHESWANAEAQARVAARNMAGAHERFAQTAWFWSDQYDHQLQVCGEPGLGTQEATRALDGGGVLIFHLDAGHRLVGASAFGTLAAIGREARLARMLVERGTVAEVAQLADPSVKLKALLS